MQQSSAHRLPGHDGFEQVLDLSDGIDAGSCRVDPSLTRY